MRRSYCWTARRIDPDFTAVHVQLLLPDRYAMLHFLDHVAAGPERPGPMRRPRRERDARPSPGDPAPPGAAGGARRGPRAAPRGAAPAEPPCPPLFAAPVRGRRQPT